MILVLKILLFIYVVIKIIDKIVKIITLLCGICNNCFVNIVGIENLTTCIDSKIDLCLQKNHTPNLVRLQILVKFDQLSPNEETGFASLAGATFKCGNILQKVRKFGE